MTSWFRGVQFWMLTEGWWLAGLSVLGRKIDESADLQGLRSTAKIDDGDRQRRWLRRSHPRSWPDCQRRPQGLASKTGFSALPLDHLRSLINKLVNVPTTSLASCLCRAR